MSGGGGKGGSSSSTVSIPPEVLARYNAVNAQAERLGGTDAAGNPNTPFTPYSNDPNAFVAPLTPTQQAGIANTNASAGAAQPWYQRAGGLAAASAQNVNPEQYSSGQIANYMNPFAQQVVAGTLAPQLQQQAIDRQNLTSSNIRAGAFGGDRAAISDAVLRGQQNMATGATVAGLLNPMFNQAQQEFNTQQGVNLAAQQANRQNYQTAAGLLGNLGTGAQTAALTGAQAQLSAGQQQQQTQQAGLTALYNQFLQQQSYPFQTTQFLANIAEGTGALSGSTTTGQQSGGFFSDERVKEDIEPIGETYDGQKIIKFRYKGDKGPKQIGLSAQDVERHHPHAVGDYHGIKTVDYDEATRDAAHRGHFYAGGLASMGGAALDTGYRENFDGGGSTDQASLMAQLGLGRQPINPYGSMAGMQSAVPTQRNIMTGSMSQPKGLMTANLPAKQPTGLSQAMSFGKGLADVVGSKGTKDKSGEYSGGSGLAGLYQSGKDFFSDKVAARGGRMGYALDGSVDDDQPEKPDMPDLSKPTDQFKPEEDDPLKHQNKLVIPDDNPQAKLNPAQLPSGGGGGGGLGGLLGGAGSFMSGAAKIAPFFLAHGGLAANRPHHATQGREDGDSTPPVQAYNVPQDPVAALNDINEQSNLPSGFMPRLAQIESGMGRNVYNPKSNAMGWFQHIPSTAKARGIDPLDFQQSATDAAKMAAENRSYLRQNAGVEDPNGAHLYLAHQQGPAGAAALLRAGDQSAIDALTPIYAKRIGDPEKARSVATAAVINNGGNADMSASDFAARIMGMYTGAKVPSGLGISGSKKLAPLDEGALGAIQKIPVIGKLAKSEEQGGLSDNAKLALLGGLGGMLASPNRTFLGALGSGLTSGVEAYQGMGGLGVQQQLANLKEQYAPIAADLTSAEAAAKRAETQRASTAITSMGIFKFGADGKTYTQKEYNELEAQGKAPALLGYVPSDSEKRVREKVGLPTAETTTGTAGAQPAPKKETATLTFSPTPTYDEKSQSTAKQDDVTGTTPQAMESAKKASENYATNVQQSAQAARDTSIMAREQIKQLMDNKEKGIVQTGALFNFGAGATNLINSIGRQFGVENVAGNADAQKSVLDKINTLSASQLAALGGQHAVEAMRRLIEASANPTMSPEAWSEILSSLGAQGVRSKDQANHLSQWNKDSNGYSQNAGADFERLHTPDRYDAEKNAYKDLMLNNPAAFRAFSSGTMPDGRKLTREQIDKKLAEMYPGTRNMSRWFLGGT